MSNKFVLKVEGETAQLFNNLLDNVVEDYHIEKSYAKISLQQVMRDSEVLNLIATKLTLILETDQLRKEEN